MPRTTTTPTRGATTVMARTTTMPQQMSAGPRGNNWYGIAAFIALLLLVAGGIVLYSQLTKKDKADAASFALPDVTGMQLDEASKILQDDNGLLLKLQEQPTDGVAEGAVISTDPVAQTLVKKGQEITVVYNPIKAPVPVPQVQGMTVDQATAALSAVGFSVSPDTVFVVSEQPPNTVLSTNPPFGQSAKQGTVVILTVSKAPDQVSVPDVTGQGGDAAKAFLAAEPYAFDVTVTSEPSADIPANTVLRTDPAVNTPVAKGSKINLIVSAGPAKVRVPPVEGLTEASARNQLTTSGFVANVVYVTVATGSVQDGIVISQSIPSSESALPGTTITICRSARLLRRRPPPPPRRQRPRRSPRPRHRHLPQI